MDEIDIFLKKQIRFKPNTDFISREGITFLKHIGERGERSQWISRACELLYDYENHKKGFLVQMMQDNFEICKYILRKIGRNRNALPGM